MKTGKFFRDDGTIGTISQRGMDKLTLDDDHFLHSFEDHSAHTLFDSKGNVIVKKFYIHGYLHREDNKPAIINFNTRGRIKYEAFYINGKEIKMEETV